MSQNGFAGAEGTKLDPQDAPALDAAVPPPPPGVACPRIDVPRSWTDIAVCGCASCAAIDRIRQTCEQLGEYLFVFDGRPFRCGWRIADIRLLFVRIATIGPPYDTQEAAAREVLRRQSHCDCYVSSWPLVPAGRKDFLWQVESIE